MSVYITARASYQQALLQYKSSSRFQTRLQPHRQTGREASEQGATVIQSAVYERPDQDVRSVHFERRISRSWRWKKHYAGDVADVSSQWRIAIDIDTKVPMNFGVSRSSNSTVWHAWCASTRCLARRCQRHDSNGTSEWQHLLHQYSMIVCNSKYLSLVIPYLQVLKSI